MRPKIAAVLRRLANRIDRDSAPQVWVATPPYVSGTSATTTARFEWKDAA